MLSESLIPFSQSRGPKTDRSHALKVQFNHNFRPMRAKRRDRTVGTGSRFVLNAPKGARARGGSRARVERAQRSVVLCLLSAAMRHSTPTKSCHVPYM